MDTNNVLMSVTDKTGLVKLAQGLCSLGKTIYASGGTAAYLKAHTISVTDIDGIVGKPILGGRVKTLSREIHAGLLARNTPEDHAELEAEGIPWIEILVVNFYNLRIALAEFREGTLRADQLLEKIDIGGPAMARSAAKGGRIILTNPDVYDLWLGHIKSGIADRERHRLILARMAEARVHEYTGAAGEAYDALFLPTRD